MVEVAEENDTIRDCRKASRQLSRGIGRPVEVPKVFDLVRVEPRFNVRKQAVVDFHAWLKAAHEVKDGAAVPLTYFLAWIKAKAKIVVAPNPRASAYQSPCRVRTSVKKSVFNMQRIIFPRRLSLTG